MAINKGSELHHWYEFLHSYCTFELVQDSDHSGVVRIFVGLSCEPWGFINFTSSITLHYVEQFFPYQGCNFVAANAKLPDTLQMAKSGIRDPAVCAKWRTTRKWFCNGRGNTSGRWELGNSFYAPLVYCVSECNWLALRILRCVKTTVTCVYTTWV